MTRLCLLVLCAVLAGCGGDDAGGDENHGYGASFDVMGPGGLRLRYSQALPSTSHFSTVDVYENAFQEVMRCTGLSAPMPPFVIILPELSGENGQFIPDPDLILLDSRRLPVVTKHQMLHYLLFRTTGSQDAAHASISSITGASLFQQCANDGLTIPALGIRILPSNKIVPVSL